ncbi:hypothetical protein Hanom_Chr16g01487581 [Helianthus anomalus]
MDGPGGLNFVFCSTFSSHFCQKYTNGPCGFHVVTYLVTKLDLPKPLDLLVGDKIHYKVQTTWTICVLLES